MAKRMYADVIMNGQEVNLAIRANSIKEAKTKINTFPEYKGVTEIIEVSPNPPRRVEDNIEEVPAPFFRKYKKISLCTGSLAVAR